MYPVNAAGRGAYRVRASNRDALSVKGRSALGTAKASTTAWLTVNPSMPNKSDKARMPDSLTIKFKCVCTPEEQSMEVRTRRPDEDILEYMDYVTALLGKWHRGRMCLSNKLEYMKMPIPSENGRVGDKPETRH